MGIRCLTPHIPQLAPVDAKYQLKESMVKHAQSICKITEEGEHRGTGFLFTREFLITCFHVLNPNKENLSDWTASFERLYVERMIIDLSQVPSESPPISMSIDPVSFSSEVFTFSEVDLIKTSSFTLPKPGKVTPEFLDYTIVKLKEENRSTLDRLAQRHFTLYTEKDEPQDEEYILFQHPQRFDEATRQKGIMRFSVGRKIEGPADLEKSALVLYHNIPTFPGSSGGPLSYSSSPYLKAIHARGFQGKSMSNHLPSAATSSSTVHGSDTASYNTAILTNAIKEDLDKKALAGDPHTRQLFAALRTNEANLYRNYNSLDRLGMDESISVKRMNEIDELNRLLWTERPATSTKIVMIQGLGGVGKTEFISHFANYYKHRYQHIPRINNGTVDSVTETLDSLKTSSSDSKLRLVIIDPISSAFENGDFLATLRSITNVHILIATREWLYPHEDGVEHLTLSPFSQEESLYYLKRNLKTSHLDQESAKKLSDELGCFPQAMERFGRFLNNSKASTSIARESDAVRSTIVSQVWEHFQNITWKNELNIIKSDTSLMKIVEFIATIADAPFPEKLIESIPEINRPDLPEKLAILRKYFIIRDVGGGMLASYRLIQEVFYESIKEEERESVCIATQDALNMYITPSSDEHEIIEKHRKAAIALMTNSIRHEESVDLIPLQNRHCLDPSLDNSSASSSVSTLA